MNPWEKLPIDTYENHMSLSQVAQLQTLNRIMKSQWAAHPNASSVAVLGIAGGNGLEHCGESVRKVYGIDINQSYLERCAQRFEPILGGRLRLLQMDVMQPEAELPQVDLLIADLVIEYVGVENFCAKAAQARIGYISCVIQSSSQNFVSESPYQDQFREISELHRDVDEQTLTYALLKRGYVLVCREAVALPNGKRFIRLDYKARQTGPGKKKAIIQNEDFV